LLLFLGEHRAGSRMSFGIIRDGRSARFPSHSASCPKRVVTHGGRISRSRGAGELRHPRTSRFCGDAPCVVECAAS
jgi:hypothetical protein